MRLVEANLPNQRTGVREANIALIEDFLNSKMDCAEVVDYHWVSAQSAYSSLHDTICDRGFKGLARVKTKGNSIYLVRGCGANG